MNTRPHGTEEPSRQTAGRPAEIAEADPAPDAGSGPAPAAETWARAQLRDRIQRAAAGLIPAGEPAHGRTRESDRSPVDIEAEP